MVRICCPYCCTEIIDIPEDGLCPKCRGNLSQEGSPETAAFRRRLPWIFFCLAIMPNFLEWLYWSPLVLSKLKRSAEEACITIMLLYTICRCWVSYIMPNYSLYINSEAPPIRRSNRSGMKVCVKCFAIIEVLLFVIGRFWNSAYMKTSQGMPIVFHVVSLYYFLLSMVNIYFYEDIRYDLIRQRVDTQLLPPKGSPRRRYRYAELNMAFVLVGLFFGLLADVIARTLG